MKVHGKFAMVIDMLERPEVLGVLAPCLCVLFPSAQKKSRAISSADTIFQKIFAKQLHQKTPPKIWAEPQFGSGGKHY